MDCIVKVLQLWLWQSDMEPVAHSCSSYLDQGPQKMVLRSIDAQVFVAEETFKAFTKENGQERDDKGVWSSIYSVTYSGLPLWSSVYLNIYFLSTVTVITAMYSLTRY